MVYDLVAQHKLVVVPFHEHEQPLVPEQVGRRKPWQGFEVAQLVTDQRLHARDAIGTSLHVLKPALAVI